MPRVEPKQVQRELEKGMLWPVYWLHGGETMKVREVLKRIRTAVFGGAQGGLQGLSEETLEGNEVTAATVVDAAQSLALGGGTRLVIIRDAHLIDDAELLEPLLGGPRPREETPSVCVFVSKDLDGRKKFTKTLLEKAAVVPCEQVPDEERDAWAGYLAKRRNMEVPSELYPVLRSLEPWSLDIIDSELEKLSLAGGDTAVIQGGGAGDGAEEFLSAFFLRNKAGALRAVGLFAESPEISIPLLGLLAWNVRHLAVIVSGRDGASSLRLSPFVMDRFRRWSGGWTLPEVQALQERLAELDFCVKQTPKLPLGLWTDLVAEFTR